jgi:hypothetical protein
MEDNSKPAAPTRGPGPTRTKSQIRASAMADAAAIKSKWKTLIPAAGALWTKVHGDDLARVDGNFHKLAGLVQLRCGLSREESDKQVKDFFAKHYPVAPNAPAL